MPKQFKKYLRFDGGLNTNADSRDIGENELSDINNMMVDHVGKIRTIGQLSEPSHTIEPPAITISKGYNFFIFGSDHHFIVGGDRDTAVVTNNSGQAYFSVAGGTFTNGDFVFHYGFAETTYNGWKVVENSTGTSYETGDTYVSSGSGTTLDYGATELFEKINIIVIVDESTGYVYIRTYGSGSYDDKFFNMGTTSGIKAIFYYINNALRMCDANFGTDNDPKWFGYIFRRHFTVAAGDQFNGWYAVDSAISPPTAGLVHTSKTPTADGDSTGTQLKDDGVIQDWSLTGSEGYIAIDSANNDAYYITAQGATPFELTTQSLAPGTWGGLAYFIYPPSGEGFNLAIESNGSSGTWSADELEFASSFLYDDNQESLPSKMSGVFTPTVDEAIDIRVFATNMYNARLSGGRIYYRITNSGDTWKLLADISMPQGIRTSLEKGFSEWTAEGASAGVATGPNNTYFYSDITIEDPGALSYEAITGVPQDELTITAKYKTATILNNRAFIANIAKNNIDGDEEYFDDRIMFSGVNSFDVFPSSFYISLGLDDGDEFTALRGYADRLFAFKKNKLFVINIAQGSSQGWFVESQHEHLGVEISAATFKTDYGLIWANKNGCYLFNGSQIQNLLERNGQRIISQSDWATFITVDAIIGYEPMKRQIIVLGDTDATAGNIYMFDLATLSWTKGDKFSQSASGAYTNFAILDNELLIGKYTA